jgi:hypothetical protein
MKESASVLCRGRRVFQGENLFSKGAAYSALLHTDRPAEIPESVFLSPDALRSNIGIEVLMREQVGYHVLLDAGVKWYNAEVEEDFILDTGREFNLVQTPVTGGEPRTLTVELDGLPERPDRATRLLVRMNCTASDRCRISVEDLGFGEFYPATHRIWSREIDL